MIRKKKLLRHNGLTRFTPPVRNFPTKAKVDTTAYYQYHIANSKGYCENCKTFISMAQEWQKFAAQCHILDKELFPEVAAEIANRWEGCLQCHDTYDSGNDRLILNFNVLPDLKERLDLFINKVDPANLHKVPIYLRTPKFVELYNNVPRETNVQ